MQSVSSVWVHICAIMRIAVLHPRLYSPNFRIREEGNGFRVQRWLVNVFPDLKNKKCLLTAILAIVYDSFELDLNPLR